MLWPISRDVVFLPWDCGHWCTRVYLTVLVMDHQKNTEHLINLIQNQHAEGLLRLNFFSSSKVQCRGGFVTCAGHGEVSHTQLSLYWGHLAWILSTGSLQSEPSKVFLVFLFFIMGCCLHHWQAFLLIYLTEVRLTLCNVHAVQSTTRFNMLSCQEVDC